MSSRVFVSLEGEGMKRSRWLHLCVKSGVCWSRMKGLLRGLGNEAVCWAVSRVGVELCVRGLEGQEGGGGGLAVQKTEENKDSCPSATF